MPEFKTVMDVFQRLDKSNCRKCNERTCLAFAAAVIQGRRSPDDCPAFDRSGLNGTPTTVGSDSAADSDPMGALAALQTRITGIDLAERAERLGGHFSGDRLTLKVMGKDFNVDRTGGLSTDIHINAWVAGPVLLYVLQGGEPTVSGDWVPFRELPGGRERQRLFHQRCERPLKAVADRYTDLFADLVDLFGGRPVAGHFDADIGVVLKPLPNLPLLICYWRPEEEMGSDAALFFDRTAEDHLCADGLFTLGTGLVTMFEKIALRHGMHP